MLRGTVTALTRSADVAGVFVVGGLLTLLTWVITPVWVGGTLFFPPLVLLAPLALAPAFVVRGYFVRVLTAGIETGNADGAPAFVAWNELYRDGVKSALLSAVLLAPLGAVIALAALAIGVLGSGVVEPAPTVDAAQTALGDGAVPAVAGVVVGLVGAASAAYLLAFAYVRPAALAAFAASGRLRDGFRPRRVARVAGSGPYATAWLVAAATLGAGYALAGPFVPLVVGTAFVFVVRVAAYGVYGRGAATLEVVDPSDEGGARKSTAAEGTEASTGFVRSPTPEVPPTVQTGRSVPIGGAGFGGTGAEKARTDGSASRRTSAVDGPADAFDWCAPAPDGETGSGDGDGGTDALDDTSNAPGAFDWRVDIADPKDKR